MQLEADATWAASLYAELSRRVGEDVELGAVEEAFGFRFAPIQGGGQWRDPYSSRVLHDAVRRSFVAFVEQLLAACEQLPGLDPCERLHGATQWARRVCATACEQLVPLLIDRASTWQDLLAQANALVDHATRASLQRARGAPRRAGARDAPAAARVRRRGRRARAGGASAWSRSRGRRS